jgi:hypothetical protein
VFTPLTGWHRKPRPNTEGLPLRNARGNPGNPISKVRPNARGTVRVFRHDFALSTLEDAIEVRAFAPLEALARVRPIPFLSGVHYLLLFALSTTSQHRRAALLWAETPHSKQTWGPVHTVLLVLLLLLVWLALGLGLQGQALVWGQVQRGCCCLGPKVGQSYPTRQLSLCTVRVFRQKSALEDAIGSHAFAPLEASRRVTNATPLGCPLLLPVGTVNCVQTLKAGDGVVRCPSPPSCLHSSLATSSPTNLCQSWLYSARFPAFGRILQRLGVRCNSRCCWS